MSSRRLAVAPHAALVALLAAAAPAPAQTTYTTIPAGSAFAGACTGSTSGAGGPRPGRFPLNASYYDGRHECAASTAAGPTGTVGSTLSAGSQSLAASARADLGTARVYAEQHVRNWQVEDLFFPTSRAFAGWVDEITIDAPGLTGQQGTFSADLHLTGTLSAFGYQGVAAFRVSEFHGPNFGNERSVFDLTRRDDANVYTVDQIVSTSVPFVFGTPFRYGVFAAAQTSVGSEGGLNHLPGDATADFDDTVRWLGLTAVRSGSAPGGPTVAGYTVTTLSGADWVVGPTAVVPEPGTTALLATGLAALGAAARARRRR